MNCPDCNTSNQAGAPACRACGYDLPATCHACGALVTDGEDLCVDCRTARLPDELAADLDMIEEEILAEDGGDTPPPTETTGDPEFKLAPRFVGRRALLEQLREHVTEALRRREPCFVALTGPSGVGKTRLCRELGQSVRAVIPEVRVLLGQCGGPGAPPFAAFARLLCARFGIGEGEAPRTAREKISRGVGEVVPGARAVEIAHLIGHLVRYPFPDSPVVEPLTETPTQLEARMFIAAKRLLAADAARAPLLLLLDDVENASPETVNLLHYLAAGLESLPLAMVAVGRPDLFQVHPSFGEGDVALDRVEVGPLSPDESAQLFTELVRQAGDPPAELIRHVRERLGGLPRSLFELTRYLVEAQVLVRDGERWRFDRRRLAATELPTTIEELLGARLATLDGRERDILEKASACGEVFWLDALVALLRAESLRGGDPDGPSLGQIAAAGDRTRVEVAAILSVLERRGLVTPSSHSSIPGEREYRFLYPPWRDVVRRSVGDEARHTHHRLLAQWLELRPQGRGEEQQEEIALHLEQAGDGDAASLRYRRAGDAARARYYNDKAIRLYDHALRCLPAPDLAGRIQLWHDLGSVYQIQGHHEPALQAFERMLRLAWVVSSRAKAAVAYNKMGRIHRQKGDLQLALEYLERSLELFQQAGDERGVASSLDDIGQVLWLLGRYDEALDRGAASLELRRKFGDKRSIAVSLLNIGHIERHRGLFDAAESCYREALQIRRHLTDRAGIAQSLNGLGVLAFQRGDLDGARREWEEALGIAEEIGAVPVQAMVEGHLGELAFALGNAAEARTRFLRSDQLAREVDDRRLRAEAARNLGLIELSAGAADRALELCERSLAIAEAAGIRVDVGRALIALGQVHATTLFDDTGHANQKAADYFQRGVAVLREIGNSAELALGLRRFGAFRVETGDVEAARALLGEALGIFRQLGMADGEAVAQMLGDLG